MPTAAERLTSTSGQDQIEAAISKCISMMADEHPEWDNDQRVAACYSMAKKATGKEMPMKHKEG